MTTNDLKEYAEFNRAFLAAVRNAKKAGKSSTMWRQWKMPPNTPDTLLRSPPAEEQRPGDLRRAK